MLERLGYRIERQCGFSLGETLDARASFRSTAARLLYDRLPWLKENQTTVAVRERRTGFR